MKDMSSVRSVRVWRDGRVDTTDVDHATLVRALKDPDALVWLDLLRPSHEALAELGKDLDLGATALEDAVGVHERPKVSRRDSHIFFTTAAVRLDDDAPATREGRGRLRTSRISGFVLPRALVTVSLDDDLDLDPVVAAWEENAHLLPAGPLALVHGLLDVVVDGHFDTIQALDDDIEALEDELFDERVRGRSFLHGVYGLRKDLVALRRIVLPMREVVNGLLRHRREGPGAPGTPAPAGDAGRRDETGPAADARRELDSWFDDLYDHVLRAAEWTESLRDMVTSLFETNLSLQDARLNDIMKRLASWAAIIAVPTAVTGWYGQNVPYPGFSSHWGLVQSAVLVVALPLLLWVLLRRKGWV